jgi:molybdopterin/thiamine biosynthesis adenylyltransferase
VLYPPAYDQGVHPTVIAPHLPIDRHIGPGGQLCLDHPVLGETEEMTGAEAVMLAENLWWYWENDRDERRRREADAADPRANSIPHEDNSAIVLSGLDATRTARGVLRVGLSHLRPARGAATGLRLDEPDRGEQEVPAINVPFAGGMEVLGLWQRVPDRPPLGGEQAVIEWAQRDDAVVEAALRLAEVHRQVSRRPDAPALVALVYEDEGPGRDDRYDTWLLLLIDADGTRRCPARSCSARTRRRAVNLGWRYLPTDALASSVSAPLAVHLGRAGVGEFALVDHDIVTAGNRIRHDLDLTAVGLAKVDAMARRLLLINPAVTCTPIRERYGSGWQASDDAVYEVLAGCDLIVNATAHVPTGYHLSATGREAERPVLHTWVSAGAWGGRVLLQCAGSGCMKCLFLHKLEPGAVPEWSEDPDPRVVTDRGCADPSFTGAGFDIAETSCAATRVAVGALSEPDGGYPPPPGDLLTLRLRRAGDAAVKVAVSSVPIHGDCDICGNG